MRRRKRSGSRLAGAGRFVRRFAFLLALVSAAGLVVVNSTDAPWAREVRTVVNDAVAPVVDGISVPVRAVARWIDAIGERDEVGREVVRLREEVVGLRLRAMEADRLALENERLRALLNARPRVQGRHVGAQVIADPGGPYVRTLLVDVGRNQGVRRGMAVVAPSGLVGRIVAVGTGTSRVLLVSDLNSRIPVMLKRNEERGILAGANTDRPRLVFVRRKIVVREGDEIVTSGFGGVLPPGLPIGTVSRIESGSFVVRPSVDWNRLSRVWVVDYEAPGLVRSPDHDLLPMATPGTVPGAVPKEAGTTSR